MNKNFIENSKNLDQIDSKKELKNSYLFLARHVTLDYYDCDTDVLLNNKLLEEKLKDSAKIV
jgi:S-adenosylmethionine/arginine decarboxylase-like enzyme